MVPTLMLHCLLPCLTPDHDFGQLVYAPCMHFLMKGGAKLLDKSWDETQQAALLLHMLPGIELAGASCFVDSPWLPQHLVAREHPAELHVPCKT